MRKWILECILVAGHAVACAPAATSSDSGGDASGPVGPSEDGGVVEGGRPAEPGPSGPATSCSTGSLFAGSVTFEGAATEVPASRTSILADPPLHWQSLTFAGAQLYTNVEGELWTTDTKSPNPVETKVAGQNGNPYKFEAGSCATARFARIRGVAALKDGSIVVADVLGNGVLHVTNPTAPTCAVEYWVGNHTAGEIDPFSRPGAGDLDGPTATAKIGGPEALTTDEDGNVFFYDAGSRKVKKIANDAAHTVSTVGKLPSTGPDSLSGLTRIGSMLYGVGTTGAAAFVVSVDPASGTFTTIKTGEFAPISGQFPAITGITTDGRGLILAGNGYLWYLTVAGELTHIAGRGRVSEFPPPDYDPKATHPAKDLVLAPAKSTLGGALDYITYHDGAIYYRGVAANVSMLSHYVERISCP